MNKQTFLESNVNNDLIDDNYIIIDFRKINKFFLGLIIILFFGYLFIANNLSVKGFVLRDYHQQLQKINQENRTLGLETASLKSYQNISQRIAKKNLVPSNEIKYIKINDQIVAKK